MLSCPPYSTSFELLAEQALASQNQSLSPCQNITADTNAPYRLSASSQSLLPTASVSTTAAPVTGKPNSMEAVLGGSLGGTLGVVLLGAVIVILRYRKRLQGLRSTSEVSSIESQALSQEKPHESLVNVVTPFLGQHRDVPLSGRLPSEYTASLSPFTI